MIGRQAIEHERDHLRKVRAWVAAGQGRTFTDGDGAEMAEVGGEDEVTFAEDSPGYREGYVVSEEERAETGEAGGRPKTGTSGKGRSPAATVLSE